MNTHSIFNFLENIIQSLRTVIFASFSLNGKYKQYINKDKEQCE